MLVRNGRSSSACAVSLQGLEYNTDWCLIGLTVTTNKQTDSGKQTNEYIITANENSTVLGVILGESDLVSVNGSCIVNCERDVRWRWGAVSELGDGGVVIPAKVRSACRHHKRFYFFLEGRLPAGEFDRQGEGVIPK